MFGNADVGGGQRGGRNVIKILGFQPLFPHMNMSDSEPDFDDPRFLIDVPSTDPSELSYTEKRKRKLKESEFKGRNKSRKQLEEEQRAIGLSNNLLDKAQKEQDSIKGGGGGGENKAFKMMQSVPIRPPLTSRETILTIDTQNQSNGFQTR